MRIIIFILSFVVFTQCKSTKNKNEETLVTTDSSESNETINGKYNVSGTVTFSNSYCGGARPTDEVLREITAAKPLAGEKYYVREGKENDLNKKIILSFITDENGKFSVKLPPGDYIIIEGNRKDKSYYENVLKTYSKATSNYSAADTSCLDNWLKGGLYSFKITDKDITDANWNIHHGCFFAAPCVNYLGPYPP